jgi:hypothetical protein
MYKVQNPSVIMDYHLNPSELAHYDVRWNMVVHLNMETDGVLFQNIRQCTKSKIQV